MKWPDFAHLDGYLPPDLEKAYRQFYLRDDTRTAGITMFLLCVLLVAFAYNDYLFFGLSINFYLLITLRSAFLVYFIFLTIYLTKNRSPEKFDLNLLIWLILSLIMVSLINLSRPASYSGNFIIDVILVLLVYLCVPMRLAFRVTGATIFTLIEIFIFFVLKVHSSPILAYTSIIALIAANLGGIFASGILYSFRRREFAERLEKEKLAEQWQTTFDSIGDAISIQDRNFQVIRANRAYYDTFKVSPEDIQGKHCYEIVHKTSSPPPHCPHVQTLHKKKPVTEELFDENLKIHVEVTTSPIFNADGEISGTVHQVKDITERKNMQKKLEEMWTHDFLTGLPNRVMLEDRFTVAAADARRRQEKLAVMTLDLDRFKLINDSLGHAAGDHVLKAVADRLKDAIRTGDTVSRIGGDEFQVLMKNAGDKDNITKLAGRILQTFQQPVRIDNQPIHTSTSIGIAIFPDDGEDLDSLSKKSDEAMYQSKGKGRNCYTFYKP